jgi:hypothetical protein
MQIEILALRHQLIVLQRRTNKRVRLSTADRLFLGHALAVMATVALSAGDRQAGNSHCLAAKRVSQVLELEE